MRVVKHESQAPNVQPSIPHIVPYGGAISFMVIVVISLPERNSHWDTDNCQNLQNPGCHRPHAGVFPTTTTSLTLAGFWCSLLLSVFEFPQCSNGQCQINAWLKYFVRFVKKIALPVVHSVTYFWWGQPNLTKFDKGEG